MRRCAFALVLLFSCAGFGRIAVAADTARSYTIDPAHSQLEIIGIESGGEVRAVFKKYSAAVAFAPDALATSKADVVIDMSSIDSQDKDRDAALRGPDLFDAAQFPTAHFVTRSFGLSERGFSAFGTLTMHGVTKNLVVFFNFAQSDDGPIMEGAARIKRLDFGVGKGKWEGFQELADSVRIKFKILLMPKK